MVVQISVTLSEENVEWMDEKNLNRSGVIDELITEHRNGQSSAAARELRRRQLEHEREMLDRQAETIQEEIEEIESQHENTEAERRRIAQEAVESIGVEPSYGYENDAAETWAAKADMRPESFWELYTEVYNDIHGDE